MDITRHYSILNPSSLEPFKIHIIGCGATGTRMTEDLVRFGFTNFTLWDSDIVEPINRANQLYNKVDEKVLKTTALKKNMLAIEPSLIIKEMSNFIDDDITTKELNSQKSFVFMFTDNKESRIDIFNKVRLNPKVLGVLNTRVGFESGVVNIFNPMLLSHCKEYSKTFDGDVESRATSPCGQAITLSYTMAQAIVYANIMFKSYILKENPPNVMEFCLDFKQPIFITTCVSWK